MAAVTTLKAGDAFPEDVVFMHVPVTPQTTDTVSCGFPKRYDASLGLSFHCFLSFFSVIVAHVAVNLTHVPNVSIQYVQSKNIQLTLLRIQKQKGRSRGRPGRIHANMPTTSPVNIH